MLKEENYRITPAICTHITIMVCVSILMSQRCLISPQRQVYSLSPDNTFWDEVDKVLDSMKPMPEAQRLLYVAPPRFDCSHSPCFLSSYLQVILSCDRRTYSVTPGATAAAPINDTTAGGEQSLIQQCIEDFIEVPRGTTVA